MRPVAGKLALALVALNLATLILVAAVSADDGYWGAGNRVLPPDALPISTVAQMLEDRGYSRIYGIEANHDAYEIKALDAAGKRIRLTVDPVTGDLRS